MGRRLGGGLVGALAIVGLAVGSAVFPSLKSIPNLDNVPGTSTACQVCHVDAQGTGGLNPFGTTVRSNLDGNGQPDWSRIRPIDSDHDGYTNGEELGDPFFRWTPGSPNPGLASAVTHPGDPTSKPAHASSVQGVITPTTWAVIKALFQ